MNVLIADRLTPEAAEGLEALGLSVEIKPDLTVDSLPEALPGVDVLVVHSTPVTRRAIDAADSLHLIVTTALQHAHVDVDAASDNAIIVAECAEPSHDARAEFALAQLLRLDRTREASTGHGALPEALGLRDRCLGILGFSPSAERLASLARGCGMTVRIAAAEVSNAVASELGIGHCSSPEELMARADYVSHHGDLLLTSETLALLESPMVFVSVDRPTTLCFDALIEACCERGARVALDVCATEEGDALHQLTEHPNALVTRGLAGATLQALDTLSRGVVKTVHTMLLSGRLQNGVNLSSTPQAPVTMVIRQTQDAGALAVLFDALRAFEVEVLDVHSQLFTNGKTASVSIQLGKVPPPRLIDQLRRQGNIQRLDVVCHHHD